KTYGITYTPEQVVISSGAKHSLHTALAALVGPGDDVIIPTPYWVSYSDLVQMTGATPVLVPTTLESGFKVNPAQLRASVNPCSVSQYAAIAALEGDQGCLETMRKEFEARRDLVCKRLSAMRGIRCPVPGGAFYAFFDVSAHFGRTIGGVAINDSATFCRAA